MSMVWQPYQISDLISQDIGTLDTASDWLIGIGYGNLGQIMSSTYNHESLEFSRKIVSGKSCNWLFCKYLQTNNHSQCQLHNKKKIKVCVRRFHSWYRITGYRKQEIIIIKKKHGKQNSLIEHFPYCFPVQKSLRSRNCGISFICGTTPIQPET